MELQDTKNVLEKGFSPNNHRPVRIGLHFLQFLNQAVVGLVPGCVIAVVVVFRLPQALLLLVLLDELREPVARVRSQVYVHGPFRSLFIGFPSIIFSFFVFGASRVKLAAPARHGVARPRTIAETMGTEVLRFEMCMWEYEKLVV